MQPFEWWRASGRYHGLCMIVSGFDVTPKSNIYGKHILHRSESYLILFATSEDCQHYICILFPLD